MDNSQTLRNIPLDVCGPFHTPTLLLIVIYHIFYRWFFFCFRYIFLIKNRVSFYVLNPLENHLEKRFKIVRSVRDRKYSSQSNLTKYGTCGKVSLKNMACCWIHHGGAERYSHTLKDVVGICWTTWHYSISMGEDLKMVIRTF